MLYELMVYAVVSASVVPVVLSLQRIGLARVMDFAGADCLMSVGF